MPAQDWVLVETEKVAPPPPPPDTARTYAIVAEPGTEPAGQPLAKAYSLLSELEDDGWSSSSALYLAYAKLFAQAPTQTALGGVIAITRATPVAEEWTIDILGTDDGDYKLFDGVVEIATFTAAGNTDLQIRDGLIASLIAGYTGLGVDSDTFTVTRDEAGIPVTMSQTSPNSDANLDIGLGPTIASVGIYEDLAAAWKLLKWWGAYGPGSSDDENKEGRRWSAADKVSRRNFWFAESDDAGIPDSADLDNLALELLALKADRINLLQHPAPTEYMQAAALGRLGGSFPGSRAWHKLDLAGSAETAITADRSSSQTATMIARRVSYTERMAGPASPLELLGGYTPDGFFVYQVWAEDHWWYTVNAAINARLKANIGVNLDEDGLAELRSVAEATTIPFVNEGVIADDFVVTSVPLEDVPDGEEAIGDYKTTGAIIVEATITPKLRAVRVRAEFSLV